VTTGEEMKNEWQKYLIFRINKMNAEGKTRQSGHVEAQVNIHWSMMNSLYIVLTRRLNLISYGENF
jgi:hypothetical protein